MYLFIFETFAFWKHNTYLEKRGEIIRASEALQNTCDIAGMHRSDFNTASPQNEFLVGYGWKTMISTKPTKNSTRELLKSRNSETDFFAP